MAKTATDEPSTEPWWVVLHEAVDHFFKGQVISLTHLKGGVDREIDTARLERLGAIAPVDSEQAKALQASLGPDAVTPEGDLVSTPVPAPIPPVPAPSPTP